MSDPTGQSPEFSRCPELVVSLNFTHVARAGGVIDFGLNLVQAMKAVASRNVTVVTPRRRKGRIAQVLLRYVSELVLEVRYWRHPAVALFPNYFIFPLPGSKLRRVVVVHDLQFKHFPQHTGLIKRLILNLSYRVVQKFADGVVFISCATRDDFLQRYGAPRRHAVIYNPVTIDFTSESSIPRAYPYVIANSHSYHHKNHARLIEYYQALRAEWPELRLILTGHKPRNFVETDVSELESSGIEHVGFIPKDEVIELLKGAQFFMSLSGFEGFNMSAAEAVLAGRPIVLSDIPVHREIFSDVALLVDAGSKIIPVQEILFYVRSRPKVDQHWRIKNNVKPEFAAAKYIELMTSVMPAEVTD